MTNYKMVFLDIDGTILRPDDSIEDSTRTAITTLQTKGVEVVLATGRPLHEIRDLGEELGVTSFIAYNGAYAIHEGKEILKKTMDQELVENYLQIAKEQEHELVLFTHEKNYFTSLEDEMVQRFNEAFHLRRNELIHSGMLTEVLSMTIITEKEQANVPYEGFKDIHYAQVNVPGYTTCFDCIRDVVNKGVAVEAFLRYREMDRSQAVAFGDGMNDKEMLMSVGEGFAMGSGHPDLPSYAKHVTSGVYESGIYNGLKKLGLVD